MLGSNGDPLWAFAPTLIRLSCVLSRGVDSIHKYVIQYPISVTIRERNELNETRTNKNQLHDTVEMISDPTRIVVKEDSV